MKKLALYLLLFLTAPFLHGQANIGGLLFASNFAQWTVPQGNQGQMSWSSPSFCTVTSGGASFRAFTVGVPITLVDSETPANTEVITPTQANYSGFGCSISAHTVNPHNSFYFRTATAGLGEALAFAGTATYQVLLTPDWTRLGGQTSTITSATGNTSVTILDQRSAVIVPYVWGGSAYTSQPFGGGAVSSVFTRTGNVVAATGDYTVAQVTGAAPLASPAFTGTPTVPTAAPGTSTTQAASTAFVLANGVGLPTSTAIGQVPTYTGPGTTATAQIPLGGTTWYYPVEWYGAVGDATGAAGVGTDNTTAIQACLTAVAAAGKGQCLLQAKKYRITAALTIGATSVGIAGQSYGAWSTAISNQLAASAPLSALVIDSATADAVDAAGADISHPISFNRFNDFTIIRTVADTGAGTGCATQPTGHAGAAGLSIKFAGGFVVDHVWSEESACPFFFQNAGAYGTGSVENSGAMWGANGFNPIVPVYGFFYNGAQSAESFRLRNSFAQTRYPGFSGVQSVGLIVSGPNLNDIFVSGFETGFVTYGEYFQQITGGGSVASSDIHLIDTVNDSFFQDGIVIDSLTQAKGSAVEIKGGWQSTGQAGASNDSAGIRIKGSSGVTVNSVHFLNNSNMKYGVLADTSSSGIGIVGNNFLNLATASIALNAVSDATVTGNVISAAAGNTQSMIQGVSLTRSTIASNTLGGAASFGVSLDAGSSNNIVAGVSAIDPASITTTISNSGTLNTFDGVGNLISRLTGAGTPNNITFSSIPQYYNNLQLTCSFFITSGANLAMNLNADTTAAHYAYGLLFQNAGTPGASQSNSSNKALISAANGVVSLEIMEYKSATPSWTGTWSLMTIGATSLQGAVGGQWTGTDITSIKLADSGGSALFTTGSVCSLYGLN